MNTLLTFIAILLFIAVLLPVACGIWQARRRWLIRRTFESLSPEHRAALLRGWKNDVEKRAAIHAQPPCLVRKIDQFGVWQLCGHHQYHWSDLLHRCLVCRPVCAADAMRVGPDGEIDDDDIEDTDIIEPELGGES
jgi:hypothetical protein